MHCGTRFSVFHIMTNLLYELIILQPTELEWMSWCHRLFPSYVHGLAINLLLGVEPVPLRF